MEPMRGRIGGFAGRYQRHHEPSPHANGGRMARPTLTPEERFMQHVSPEPNTGCWLWLGSSARHGYGSFWLSGRLRPASRVSYELFVGGIPRGHEVMHRCDNPPCVNPDHLATGTHAMNARDMAIKYRAHRSKSGLPFGVYRQRSGKFGAAVRLDGKIVYLGVFLDTESATLAAMARKNNRLSSEGV